MFKLHPQLAKDCAVVGDFPLCKVLLNRDGLYPWLILVPRRENVREAFQLSQVDQQLLLQESNALAEWMDVYFDAEKLNVAALGNMVEQLHIHHIARFSSDPAWPNPVWGYLPAKVYSPQQIQQLVNAIKLELAKLALSFTAS